jgi:hypothetical protein
MGREQKLRTVRSHKVSDCGMQPSLMLFGETLPMLGSARQYFPDASACDHVDQRIGSTGDYAAEYISLDG